jgi:hypothetical protein
VATSDLVERTKDFFTGQIAFYERLLAQYESIAQDIQGTNLAELLEQQRLDETELSAMARDFEALAAEYKAATDLSDEDRTAIRDLAERARGLTLELCEVNAAADQTLSQRMADTRTLLDDLARGRDMLDRYRPFRDDRTGGAFVDRKV